MNITWEEPKSITRMTRTREEETEIAAALRENPSKWARVTVKDNFNQAGALAHLIKSGQRAAYRDNSEGGRFDAVTRSLESGTVAVYVRFVPTV